MSLEALPRGDCKTQLNALHEMLETKDDCTEVLHLLVSYRGSINGLINEVLEGLIRFHLMCGERTPPDSKDVKDPWYHDSLRCSL